MTIPGYNSRKNPFSNEGNEGYPPPNEGGRSRRLSWNMRWNLIMTLIMALIVLLGIILGTGCLLEPRSSHRLSLENGNNTSSSVVPHHRWCEAAANYGIATGPVMMVMGASHFVNLLARGLFGRRRSNNLPALMAGENSLVARARRACMHTRRRAQSILPNLAALTVMMYGGALLYTGIDCRTGLSLIRLVGPSIFRPNDSIFTTRHPALLTSSHPSSEEGLQEFPCTFFTNTSRFYVDVRQEDEDAAYGKGHYNESMVYSNEEGQHHENGSYIFPNGTEVCSDGTIIHPTSIIFPNAWQLGLDELLLNRTTAATISLGTCNETGFSKMTDDNGNVSFIDPTPWLDVINQFCRGANLTNATTSVPTTSVNSTTLINTSVAPTSSTSNALTNLTTLMNTTLTDLSNQPSSTNFTLFTNFTDPTNSTVDTSVPVSCTWVAGLDILAGLGLLSGMFFVSQLINRLAHRRPDTIRHIELQEIDSSTDNDEVSEPEEDNGSTDSTQLL